MTEAAICVCSHKLISSLSASRCSSASADCSPPFPDAEKTEPIPHSFQVFPGNGSMPETVPSKKCLWLNTLHGRTVCTPAHAHTGQTPALPLDAGKTDTASQLMEIYLTKKPGASSRASHKNRQLNCPLSKLPTGRDLPLVQIALTEVQTLERPFSDTALTYRQSPCFYSNPFPKASFFLRLFFYPSLCMHQQTSPAP